MPIESRWKLEPPLCSLPTYMLGPPDEPLPNDTPAWIDASRPETHFLTHHGARLLGRRLAVGLAGHGVDIGDRVLLFSPNSCYYPAIALGIWMSGAIFTGANPGFTARELAFQLKDSEATLMITTQASEQVAIEAAELAGLGEERIFIVDDAAVDPEVDIAREDAKSGTQRWTDLIASVEKGKAFIWAEPADTKNAVCTLNYSSGTTGLPKGVEITHYNAISNSLGIEIMDEGDPLFKSDSDMRSLCIIPLYHAFSQLYYIVRSCRTRRPIYVMSYFDFPAFLSHIKTYKITNTLGVPPILNAVAKHPLAKQADLSSLKYFGSGAAPLASETREMVDRMLPKARVGQGWGMSEVTCAGLLWEYHREIDGSSGELVPGFRARIVDVETGEEIIEGGVSGELWIAGPTLMRGYWRNQAATDASITIDAEGERWFRTGDVVVVDRYEPGALFSIVDRAKELIKVKGNQVAPAELEALLLGREDVADVAIIGVDVGGEERPKAFIVRAEGTHASEEDIAAWVAVRVVRYKQLRGGVEFVDAIPKNPSGKILRKVLRARAKQPTPRARL